MDSLAHEVVKILWINALLSGDDAIFLAITCRALPSWKAKLAGAVLGACVGAALRFILTAYVVVFAIVPPLVTTLAAICLAWVAIRILAHPPESLTRTSIALGTVLFPLQVAAFDNVIAITAAAKSDLLLIAAGVIGSIPLVVAFSLLILSLMNKRVMKWATVVLGVLLVTSFVAGKPSLTFALLTGFCALEVLGYPALAFVGVAIAGSIAGENILNEPAFPLREMGIRPWMMQLVGAAIVIAIGWFVRQRDQQRRGSLPSAI